MSDNGKALALHKKIVREKALEECLNDFITEHCDRVGEEDWPDSAENQSCPIVAKAMILLNL